MKIKPVRGTHDLYGKEVRKFNFIITEVKEIARKFDEKVDFYYSYLEPVTLED